MNIYSGYFGLGNTYNPLYRLDRLFNPFSVEKIITGLNKLCNVRLTKRAELALEQRDSPLLVEMQLYYSCVVKKRVLFYDLDNDKPCVRVSSGLGLSFHAVQSTSCDPIAFAKNHPVKQKLESVTAKGMFPSLLELDYKKSQWTGEFYI